MDKKVFGMKVDEHLYKKYNFDEKTGMTRLYMVNGKEMSLFATEFYATSAVYAEESPEMVEAARKIMEKVQREIVGCNPSGAGDGSGKNPLYAFRTGG